MNENIILKEAMFALKHAENADERGQVLHEFALQLAQPEYTKLVELVMH